MTSSHSIRRMLSADPATSGGNGRRRRKNRPKLSMAERDAQYRKALGLERGQPLPSQIGTQASAGGARGGRGASNKGKGKQS